MTKYRYNEGFTPENREIEVWNYQRLQEAIMNSCVQDKSGLGGFEQLPKRLDIGTTPGSFAGKANLCQEQTANDREHRERGADIIWEPGQRKVLVTGKEKLVVGDERSVVIPEKIIPAQHTFDSQIRDIRENLHSDYSIKIKPGEDFASAALRTLQEDQLQRERQSRSRRIGLIHSHPDASPFSSRDLAVFLISPDHQIFVVASSNGSLRALIASHETQRLRRDNDVILEVDCDIQSEIWSKLMRDNAQAMAKCDGVSLPVGSPQANIYFWKSMDAVIAKVAEDRKIGYYVGDSDGQLKRLRPRKKIDYV